VVDALVVDVSVVDVSVLVKLASRRFVVDREMFRHGV